jgi:hypothetical protein
MVAAARSPVSGNTTAAKAAGSADVGADGGRANEPVETASVLMAARTAMGIARRMVRRPPLLRRVGGRAEGSGLAG